MILEAEKWPCEHPHLLLLTPRHPPPFQFTPTALCTVYPTQPPKEGVLDGISNTSITKGIEIAWIPKDRAERSRTSVYCHFLRRLAHACCYCYPIVGETVEKLYSYYARTSDARRRFCSLRIFLAIQRPPYWTANSVTLISQYMTNVRMICE